MKEVGTEIRRLREERGWTGAQLAVYAGMAPSAVSQIETGRRSPNTGSLAKIAKALGVEVVDLFPIGQAPLPLDNAPSLEELHDKVACETDWLVCSEASWQAAWPRDPRPREAVKRVHETATEFARLKPLMAEQERGLRPSQKAFGGRYQRAWRRFFATMQEAHARGVAAGVITDEETLNDLVKKLGEQPRDYLEALLRAS
jgi:transcriptional regulator with XRE-family HTH domain